MQRMREQITPWRAMVGIALLLILALVLMASSLWTLRNVHANGNDLSGLPRIKNATSMFGPASGRHAHRIRPASVIPGRQFPGLAGHAAQRGGKIVLSAHTLHANTPFATNVVVSSDTTPAPFGPEPRNGPQ